MKPRIQRNSSYPAPESQREHQHRESQDDQSGRIRHYLELAERLLESDDNSRQDSGAGG